MSDSRKKVALESVSDLANLGDKVAKEGQDFSAIASLAGTCEDYADGRVGAHLHFMLRVGSSDGEAQAYCATFQRSERVDVHKSEITFLAGNSHYDFAIGDLLAYNQDEAMFVDVVEFREEPERVASGVLWPSLVRLQRLERCDNVGSDVRDVVLDRLLARLGLGAVDRESSSSASRAWFRLSDQLAGQVVKGRTEVVDAIPYLEATEWRWVCGVDGERDAFPVRLLFSPHTFRGISRVRFDPILKREIKFLEMVFRPSDLGADTAKGSTHES